MYRERLTITLEQELLAAVDATIDHSQIRNRSHAIEHALKTGLALTELTDIIIALSDTGQEKLPELYTLLNIFTPARILVISQLGQLPGAQEVALSITNATGINAEVVPGDFGTAAAISLHKQNLVKAFLYIQLSETLHLPTTLAPAYIFHRRAQTILTNLVTSDDGVTFQTTGVSFINPEILPIIPAGLASLEATIFPLLLKTSKVSTYVTQ